MYSASESMVQCPYDKAHLILQSRLPTHLVRCSKNHLLQNFAVCPHDSTHRVAHEHLDQHVKNECNARAYFEKTQIKMDPHTDEPVAPYDQKNINLPECAENWGDDSTGGYNPKEGGALLVTFRGLHGEPPAKRKEFKLLNRDRVMKLEEKILLEGPIKERDIVRIPPPEEPLRPPQGLPLALIRWDHSKQSGGYAPRVQPGLASSATSPSAITSASSPGSNATRPSASSPGSNATSPSAISPGSHATSASAKVRRSSWNQLILGRGVAPPNQLRRPFCD